MAFLIPQEDSPEDIQSSGRKGEEEILRFLRHDPQGLLQCSLCMNSQPQVSLHRLCPVVTVEEIPVSLSFLAAQEYPTIQFLLFC